MKKFVIAVVSGVLIAVITAIILNWLNSGSLKYEYEITNFNRSASIINIKIENNSNIIEKDIHIIIDNVSFILGDKKDDNIKIDSSLSNVSFNLNEHKLEIIVPSMRQNEKGDIQVMIIGGSVLEYRFNSDIIITSEKTVGSEKNYLFSDKNFDNTIFFTLTIFLSTTAAWILFIFILDYFATYENKKKDAIERLNKIIEKKGEENIIIDIKKKDA